jgi:hypothetical protein
MVGLAASKSRRNGFFVLPVFFLGAAFERGSSITQPPSPVGGAEVHYSLGENLERIDVALIGEAAKQIDMAAYVLTDSAVIEALRKAAVRGANQLKGSQVLPRELCNLVKASAC